MKKTLIVLFSACTCAMGATETFDSATKTATISLTLDVAALEAISDVNFTGQDDTKPNFFMFNGSWAENQAGALGLANNGSSTSDTTGLFGSWVKGSTSGKATDTGLGNIFTTSTNWTLIDTISLVYSYSTPEEGATTTNIALSIRYTDGAVTTYGENKSNIVFNGISGFAATGVTINDSYAVSYQVDTTFLSLAEVKAKSESMVPEPTTATLSLLALAGLAARRRRK